MQSHVTVIAVAICMEISTISHSVGTGLISPSCPSSFSRVDSNHAIPLPRHPLAWFHGIRFPMLRPRAPFVPHLPLHLFPVSHGGVETPCQVVKWKAHCKVHNQPTTSRCVLLEGASAIGRIPPPDRAILPVFPSNFGLRETDRSARGGASALRRV